MAKDWQNYVVYLRKCEQRRCKENCRRFTHFVNCQTVLSRYAQWCETDQSQLRHGPFLENWFHCWRPEQWKLVHCSLLSTRPRRIGLKKRNFESNCYLIPWRTHFWLVENQRTARVHCIFSLQNYEKYPRFVFPHPITNQRLLLYEETTRFTSEEYAIESVWNDSGNLLEKCGVCEDLNCREGSKFVTAQPKNDEWVSFAQLRL